MKLEVLNISIVLHVEFFNPVINLYSRLGFVKTIENGVYHEMVWIPGKFPLKNENNNWLLTTMRARK